MIYLNNSATSFPKPDAVIDAVTRYSRTVPFHSLRSGADSRQHDLVYETREKLCRLFHADHPDNIIFTSSATHAINLVLTGILEENDHVITTAIEHNSVLRPLKTIEQQKKIRLSIVKCSRAGLIDPEDIQRELTGHTKAVVINHCSNVTGSIQDIVQTGKIVSAHDAYFIVDGSQSAGSLDIDIQAARIDSFVFTGHKALFGLQGIGGCYISPRMNPLPLITGGTGVRSDYLFQPPERPMYYEAGTPNMPGIVSLNAGVTFVQNEGIQAIRDKKKELKKLVLEAFFNMNSLNVYGGSQPQDFENTDGIISFNIRGLSPQDTGYILENSFGIICRSGLHCAPLIHESLGSHPRGSVRISFSYFNDRKDAEKLIDTVHKIGHSR